MAIFTQLQKQLSEQLHHASFNGDIQCLQVEMDCAQELPFLNWLKSQPLFPHFYWQARDRDEIWLSCGALLHFYQLDQAQLFSLQTRFPLVGGRKFEGETHFILPRLLFVKKDRHLTACLFAKSNDAITQQLLNHMTKWHQHENPKEYHIVNRHEVCHFAQWEKNIQHAQNAIQIKQFDKVVLANAMQFHLDKPLCPYTFLIQSQQKNQGCFHFLWSENAQLAFIGSSPERLYQRNGALLLTEALAGTAAVLNDEIQTEKNAQWLLNDAKNIYENQLVVEDIYSHLQDSLEEFEVSEREIKRLHNVQHLRRRIQAKIRTGMNDCEILTRIHPTAAVAGLPRQAALSFIQQHENFKRGWYAGTLGYFTPQQAEFCVALRSAQIQSEQMTCYAGAGIVAGSEAQSEWQEISRKSLALATLLKE